MSADDISFVAKSDLLIASFGESYMKKHKRERISYSCSNRMRELSRLLITYRNLTGRTVPFCSILHPKYFADVLAAVRILTRFDNDTMSFGVPSLALHLGTSLKIVCDELIDLILMQRPGFTCKSDQIKSCTEDISNFKKLVETRWSCEVGSLALKDLHEKRWKKPLLLPLVKEIKMFREGIFDLYEDCKEKFDNGNDDVNTYKMLVQCTLALVIMFNRRRIGDVQYLKLENYNNTCNSDYTDFNNLLTASEKMLATKYKRVVNSGKGSRKVVILFPKVLQDLIEILLKNRSKYISHENEYVFAMPGSSIPWGQGDVAIRKLAKIIGLKKPELITGNKLRKHIGTVMQIFNLTKDEEKQFSNFMGHTQKTHEEFYE